MMKKIIVILMFLVMASAALGIDAEVIGLERVLSNKIDDHHTKIIKAIDDKSNACKGGMQEWGDAFVDEKEDDFRKLLWYDRTITFFLIFFGVFLAMSFKGWREHRYRVKERQIELTQNNDVKKKFLE